MSETLIYGILERYYIFSESIEADIRAEERKKELSSSHLYGDDALKALKRIKREVNWVITGKGETQND